MNHQEKISQLRGIIRQKLSPLIQGDYLLADAPYHSNIGDSLIWQGERDFLSTLPGKNLGVSNPITFTFPDVPKSVTILLQGGGSFGDLWRYYDEFRMKVIKHYPDNPIVMFPQSVWYDDMNLVAKDAEAYSAHSNLCLCVRDQWSFDFMTTHFPPSVRVILVPDMAFFMDERLLMPWRNKSTEKNLFLLRLDKELVNTVDYAKILGDINDFEVRDWPTKEHEPSKHYWLDKISYALSWRLKNYPWLYRLSEKAFDVISDHWIRRSNVNKGLRFLSSYNRIVTSRLHVMILGILLHKCDISYFDNTSKKLSAFANTWLQDLNCVKPAMKI